MFSGFPAFFALRIRVLSFGLAGRAQREFGLSGDALETSAQGVAK
jgi:hypothetical protein